MIGGCVILFCFITFSNYAYREIFVLLLIPFLLNSKDKLQLALIVYNNKKTKKEKILSNDVIENILKKL